MRKDEDKLLFRHVKKGNKNAFDTLFRKHYSQLVRYCSGYLYDGALAEEMVQDVFIKVWENSNKIEIDTSVLAYLYRAVRNNALNEIKRQEVRLKYEKEQIRQANSYSDESEKDADYTYFRMMLSGEITKLPEKCRRIFEMAKFEGLTYDEIAGFLQVSAKTVENQMGIALRKLRVALLPYLNKIYEK